MHFSSSRRLRGPVSCGRFPDAICLCQSIAGEVFPWELPKQLFGPIEVRIPTGRPPECMKDYGQSENRREGRLRFQTGRALAGRTGTVFRPGNGAYLLDTPRANFLSFLLFSPRGPVRFALGAAFLRAMRFTFLRSSLSSILVVSATCNLFRCNLFRVSRKSGRCEFYVNREFHWAKAACARLLRAIPRVLEHFHLKC